MTNVTQSDIVKALRELGIVEGDTVHFHSSLKSMGHVEGGPDAVIDAFLEAVGESGTVAVPTLAQKDFQNAYRDWTLDRPSDVGLITETFRLRKNAVRSDQATHSIAAIGRLAEYYTADHGAYGKRIGIFGDTPFAASSPWEKYYENNVKLVFVGVPMLYNTFKHYIEYRIVEDKLNAITDEAAKEKLIERLWLFGRKGVWPFHSAPEIQNDLDKAGLLKKSNCGDAEFLLANAREVYDLARDVLEREAATRYSPEAYEWLCDCDKAAEI